MRPVSRASLGLCAAVLSAGLTASCGEQTDHASDVPAQRELNSASKTVVYFLENPADHEATARRCKADPGTLGQTSECINAAEANRKVFIWGREDALRRMRE